RDAAVDLRGADPRDHRRRLPRARRAGMVARLRTLRMGLPGPGGGLAPVSLDPATDGDAARVARAEARRPPPGDGRGQGRRSVYSTVFAGRPLPLGTPGRHPRRPAGPRPLRRSGESCREPSFPSATDGPAAPETVALADDHGPGRLGPGCI